MKRYALDVTTTLRGACVEVEAESPEAALGEGERPVRDVEESAKKID